MLLHGDDPGLHGVLPLLYELTDDGLGGWGAAANLCDENAERAVDALTLVAVDDGGQLEVHIGRRYPLAEAVQAHIDIQSRATAGKLLLLP